MALRSSWNKDPDEALLSAAREGNVETVRQLIRDGEVTISNICHGDMTALHYAALYGNENVIKELLDAGADIDATSWCFHHIEDTSRSLKSVLQCAMEGRYFGALSLLTIEGADLSFDEYDDSHGGPLNVAIAKGDIGLIEMFYKKSPHWPSEVLHFATKYAAPKVLRAMLSMGMDCEECDWKSRTPLHEAVRGEEDIARIPECENVLILLEHGARKEAIIDTDNLANYYDDEPGAGSYDDIGCTPLLLSIVYQNTKAFHLLADNGANLLAKTEDFTGEDESLIGKRTGLHLMATVFFTTSDKEVHKTNVVSMMKRLVGAGVAVDALDTDGCTALHHAVVTNNHIVVDFLLENGADLSVKATNIEKLARHDESLENVPHTTGFTPLFVALVAEHTDMVKKLLYHGASLLDRDDGGRTALHLSCYEEIPIGMLTILLDTLQDGSTEQAVIQKENSSDGGGCSSREGSSEVVAGGDSSVVVDPMIVDGVALSTHSVKTSRKDILDAVDDDGNTALHVAIWSADIDKVPSPVSLISFSVASIFLHITSANNDRYPFYYHLKVRILINKGANVEIFNRKRHHQTYIHPKCRIVVTGEKRGLPEYAGTALHIACRLGLLTIVETLIDVGGASPSLRNTNHQYIPSPSHQDELREAVELMELQIELGLIHDSSQRQDLQQELQQLQSNFVKGLPPLHVALIYGRYPIVRALLDRGANVADKDAFGRTALHLACYKDTPFETFLALLDGPRGCADIVDNADHYGNSPLHTAAWAGETEKVQELIARGANVELMNRGGSGKVGYQELRHSSGYTSEVAPPSSLLSYGGRPLHIAARIGYADVIKTLIDFGGAQPSSLDARGVSPLYLSVLFGRPAASRALLDRHAQIPALSSEDPLQLARANALEHDGSQQVEYFCSAIDTRSTHFGPSYESVLGYACTMGYTEVARALMNLGAQILTSTSGSSNPTTPLHNACRGGHAEIALALIDRGAKVAAILPGGQTPLHIAAAQGQVEMMRLLLQRETVLSEYCDAVDCVNKRSNVFGLSVCLGCRRVGYCSDR